MKENYPWRTRTLLIGVAIGALTGLGAAYLLSQRAEKRGEALTISSGEGVILGLLVLGLLRQIVLLGEDKTQK